MCEYIAIFVHIYSIFKISTCALHQYLQFCLLLSVFRIVCHQLVLPSLCGLYQADTTLSNPLSYWIECLSIGKIYTEQYSCTCVMYT